MWSYLNDLMASSRFPASPCRVRSTSLTCFTPSATESNSSQVLTFHNWFYSWIFCHKRDRLTNKMSFPSWRRLFWSFKKMYIYLVCKSLSSIFFRALRYIFMTQHKNIMRMVLESRNWKRILIFQILLRPTMPKLSQVYSFILKAGSQSAEIFRQMNSQR
jgi:hypothetical protein